MTQHEREESCIAPLFVNDCKDTAASRLADCEAIRESMMVILYDAQSLLGSKIIILHQN